ncbi:MAG: hypothetical protein Q9160_006284 [Pyrenula sp. 1 TL-2023]
MSEQRKNLSVFSTKPAHELRAFEFFLDRAAPACAGALDTKFWRHTVPQFCQSEPIIWNAVLAVSELFEYPQSDDHFAVEIPKQNRPVTNEHQRTALVAYNRALARFREIADAGTTSLPLAITSCMLFICIEAMQDNVRQYLHLCEAGCKLLGTYINTKGTGSASRNNHSSIDDLAESLFMRLSFVLVIHGYAPPENFKMQLSAEDNPDLPPLEHARYSLHAIMVKSHGFLLEGSKFITTHSPETPIPSDLLDDQSYFIAVCREWEMSLLDLRRKCEMQWTKSERAFASVLMTWAIAWRYWLGTGLSLYQSAFDQYHSDIAQLLKYAEDGLDATALPGGSQPHFTFETNTVLPVGGVAFFCRHPVLRRKALELLKRTPQKEGLWKAVPSSNLAMKAMKIEEAGLYPDDMDWSNASITDWNYPLPPEDKRVVQLFQKDKISGTHKTHLRCGYRTNDHKNSHEAHQEPRCESDLDIYEELQWLNRNYRQW